MVMGTNPPLCKSARLRVVGVLTLWLLSGVALADELTLPVTQDNSIVMVKGEWAVNAGSAGRMRIKGNQHIAKAGFTCG